MRHPVLTHNATVVVLDSYRQAGEIVQRLQQSGFDMGKTSVAAKEERLELPSADCGAFWGRMREGLSGWIKVGHPDGGMIAVAGPLGGWIVAAMENAEVFGGLSGLGAALYGLGLPHEVVLHYEGAVAADKLLLVVTGSAEEVARAQGMLQVGG